MFQFVRHIQLARCSTTILLVLSTIYSIQAQSNRDSLIIKPLPNAYGQIVDPTVNADSALVFIFTNHRCLYSKLYIERLNDLNDEMSTRGVKLVAIESKISSLENTTTSLDNYLKSASIGFTYLIDLDNEIAKSFNAKSSPQAFLLVRKGNDFEIVYQGSIDNNSRKPDRVTRFYLKDAIEQLLAGQEIKYNKAKAIGCDLRGD